MLLLSGIAKEARCVQKGHWLERYWTDERQVAGWNGIGEAFWNVALSIVGREASPLLEQMLQLDSHGHLCPLSQNCSPLSISLGSRIFLAKEKILIRQATVGLFIAI